MTEHGYVVFSTHDHLWVEGFPNIRVIILVNDLLVYVLVVVPVVLM